MTSLTVLATGPLATVQDHGRPGYADLGVPGSGGADRGALALANRLVGNAEWAAVVETTLGGFRARVDADVLVAVTGADTVVRHNGVPAGLAALLPHGAVRRGTQRSVAGTAAQGCACVRTFVSVRSDLRVRHCRGDSRLDRLDTQVQGAAR